MSFANESRRYLSTVTAAGEPIVLLAERVTGVRGFGDRSVVLVDGDAVEVVMPFGELCTYLGFPSSAAEAKANRHRRPLTRQAS